jgi:ornithine cyclodeaminase
VGRPTIQGFVALFDHATGTPLAVVEGSELTALRTAAASGLATRELARADARSHGVFGTGVQARAHIEAVACVRRIREVCVWGRNKQKCGELVAELAEVYDGVSIRSAREPSEAAACDIVSTTTATREPVLRGSWLADGTHLNVVGSHAPDRREVDAAAIRRSAVYVDHRESSLREAGDLLLAIEEGEFAASDIVGEIGEVLLQTVPGRASASQLTLYKSLGVVAQDLFAAAAVYERDTSNRGRTAINGDQ